MAISVASLSVSLTADTSNFQAGLSGAAGSMGKFAQAAQVHANTTAGLWQDAAGKWRNSLGQFASSSELASAGIAKLSNASGSVSSAAQRAANDIAKAGNAAKKGGDDARDAADKTNLLGTALQGVSARAVAVGNILSGAVMSGFHAITGAIGGAVSAVSSFEQMTAKLTALTAKELVDSGQFKNFDDALGAATEKSKTLLDWTQKLAVASPFGEGDVSAVLGVASAFGFLTQKYQTVKEAQDAGVVSAQRLTEAILNFGAATGVSGANLDSIARIAGQIKSIGKLMGGDSMQLKNFGINIEEAIGQSIGKTTQQVIEMREKGLVTADMALQALVGSMEKFGKAAELQGGSLGGLLASLDDLQKVAMRNIFGPMFESLKPALAGAITALQSPEVGAAMQNFGNSVGAGVTTALTALQNLASQAQALMSAFMAGMSTGGVGGGVSSLLTALGLDPSIASTVGSVLNSVASAVQTGMSQIQGVLASAGTAWQSFTSAALGVASQIGPALAQVASIVGGVLGSAFQTLGAIASSVFAGLPSLLQAVAGPVSTIASLVGSFLVSAFQSVGQIASSVFAGLPGLASTVMGVYTAFASFVGSTLAGAFQVILPIASSVFAGIATVVSMALPGLFAVANAVGSLLSAAFNALQGVATAVFNAILPYIPGIQAYIAALAVVVGSVLGAAFNWLAGVIRGTVIPAIQTAGAWLAQNLPGAIQVVMNFVTGTLLPGLLNLATWLAQNLPGAIQALSGFWTGVLQPAIATVWGFISGTLFPLFLQLVGWLQTNIPQALAALSGFWQEHKDQIISIAQTAWDIIKGVIDSVLGTITGLWQAFQAAREGDWRGFGEQLRAIWDAAWQAIGNALSSASETLVNILNNTSTQLVNTLNDAGQQMVNALTSIDWGQLGSDIVHGIANGISAGAGFIIDAARNAARAALDAAKGFLGISSPSKVMADEVGLPMAQGLAAGFAGGMDGSALVGIVAGIRKVMEDIGKVLKGVGDFISTSDWEDLAGPVKLMADTLHAIADIGKTVAAEGMASNWAAAQTQVNGFIASARAILTGLSSTLKGVGDFVSTSDWEDFTAPLKMLAESLSSISQISALFADEKSVPSLAGLGGTIRQLAVDARAILVDLDSAIQPISSGLPDKLKTLGDAAAGARSVADGALGLVRSLQAALAVDWSSINFSAAGQMMHDLGIMVVYFASKSQEAGQAIQRVDTSGLAPLKAAAENLIGIAEGARLIVVKLVDALTVRWGDINWPAAGVMMHDLAQMVVYFTQKALEASVVLANVDTSGLGPLKTNADNLLGIADGARAIVAKLVDALTVNWAGINWPAAGQMMHDLAQMAVYFVQKASEAAVAILAIDTSGLGPLSTSLQTVLSIAQTTRDAWDALADALTFDWNTTPFDLMLVGLSSLTVKAGQLVAVAARAALGIIGIDTSGLTPLNTALGALDSIVKATTSIWAGLMAAMQFDWSTAPFDRMLVVIDSLTVKAALLVAAASRAALAVVGIDTSGLAPLNTALESLSGVVTRTVELFNVLAGKDFPDLSNSAFAIISTRLDQLIRDALSLANRAASAITGALTVSPIMADLGRALGDILSVAKNALDIVGQLGGDKFPPLTGGALTVILTRLDEVLRAGKAINDKALAVAVGWQASVNPVMATVGTILSSGLELVSKTLDIVGQLGGDKFPPLTGDALTRILARLEDTLTAGRAIGVVASRVGATWQATVNPVMAVVGTILAAGLEIVSKTLDIVGQLSGDKFPALTGDALARILVRLEDTLNAGRAISVVGARIASQWQATTNPVMAVVGGILSSGLEIVSKTLDIVGQLAGDKFPALTNDALARILVRLEDTLNAGRAIGVVAARIATQWQATTNPVMAVVGGILNSGLDIISKTLDIVGQLGGEKFPALTGAALAGILTRLEDTLAAGKAISDKASQIAVGWQATVNPAMTAVGKILADGLEILGKTLDISALLSGDKFPGFTAADQALLLTRLATVLSVGMALSDEANRIIGDWQTVVKPALSNLGKTLKSALDGAEAVLDINSLLGGKTAPTFDLSVLLSRLALVLAAGMALGDKANEVIGSWTIIVKPALDNLGKTLKSSLDVATSVLDFSDLQSKLLSFRGFDMRLLGPKIDLLITSAIAVAQEFGQKAANAQIKEEWQKAGAALKGLFGDAASTIKDALDMGARLLDPETQIPSIGQIQAKLDALFALITNVATQYAARASSLASQGIDTKAAGELAGQIKAIFDSLSTVAQTVQDFTGIAIGSSGFNNISALLNNLFGLFDNVSSQADTVNAVTAAITSLLGGIQELVAESGFSAGQSWASQFAAGIASVAGGVTATAGGAAATIGAGAAGQTGGGGTVVNNITNNNVRNVTVSVTNTNADSARANWAGIYGLATGF